MKYLKTFSLLFITCLILSLSLNSCNQDAKGENTVEKADAKEETFKKVPELIERRVALGSNEEMDKIFSTYDKNVKALEKNPNDMEARLTLSEVFITEARLTGNHAYNYDAALQVLDDVLASTKTNKDQRFRALMNKATVKLSLHKFDEALATGKEALALNNRNAGIYGVLVDANVELGNYKAAVEMSDKMVGIRPDLRSYSRISYLRQIHGDIDGAKEAMDMAVKAGYPGMEQTEWSRVNLGKLYEQYGDLRTAEMHYTIALRERPNYPYALAAMGNLERKKENYTEAEDYLTRSMQYINDAGFYTLLGDAYRDQGMTQKADSTYNLALRIMEFGTNKTDGATPMDGNAKAYANLNGSHGHQHGLEIAKLYMKLGKDTDKAMENIMLDYDMRPDNIDVNKELALIYYEEGNIDEAAKYLSKAMATNSKDPELYSLKGLIAIKRGDATAGKRIIRESFKTNPWQEAITTDEAKEAVS
ncbi:tetratricopeptide repeat protein [Cryomorpha ignava]|uniref:Tetratricopeptide repeat protein n=1 Tax=Cryomorpha ignava TaxID=101383 RepID=A0A7K3WW31_9FLAO|nr:tetratricopeptide repeat protein [Cryomorpha ignava]NEN25132.1 tetratricopeptide repeat protein [Cryomorpha ignava]